MLNLNIGAYEDRVRHSRYFKIERLRIHFVCGHGAFIKLEDVCDERGRCDWRGRGFTAGV